MEYDQKFCNIIQFFMQSFQDLKSLFGLLLMYYAYKNFILKGPVSGFVGCQRWTVEFKRITLSVLVMIFLYDFVTPKKSNMSEGCWLFTLKMAVQSLGTSLSGDFSQM